MKYDYDLIVIGGGAAGLTASCMAGDSAAKTLLIEREEKLGGDCLHYGCVPSKTLIKSAYAHHILKNAEKYGLPKVDVPPVDLSKVAGRIQNVIDTIQVHDSPEYIKEKYNVDTQFGEAKFVDDHTIALNDKTISSRFFVLAMGSSPFVPPIDGISDVSYITNMQIFKLQKLPKDMIVLGGGPIGMEMAQAFQRLGTQVTVVEFFPKVLAREDEDISEFIEKMLREEGITFHLGTKAIKAKKTDKGVCITLEKDGQTSTLEAEQLLVATGRNNNVEGCDLDKAGVAFNQKAIPVNAKMQTNVKHIYATGDINGSLPFTHVAAYESITAVLNMIFKAPAKANYQNMPWVTYLDPEVASIGYNETRAKEAGIDYTVQKKPLKDNHRALAEEEGRGFIKIILSKGKPIGVQIVGFHAGDLISEWIPVLNGNLKLSVLSNAVHPYPTMAEINKDASVEYIVSTIPKWTKRLIKILFGYQGKA